MLAVLLTAGLVMRILVQIAYRPALLYIDSIKYLYGAYAGNDPPGYLLLLKPFLAVGNLDLVAAVQHLLGLAMAVALYLLMRRHGVPRWLAALATAPILLDGYQLQNEQTIMPDTLFEALIVTGLVILLWAPKPKTWMIIGAGLALGASATVAQIGEILILPALIYLLAAAVGGRAKLIQGIALCAAFALPILAVSFRDYVTIHRFSLAPYAQSTIYGRMAEAADCQTLRIPAYERPLCPTRQQRALGPDGLDHASRSPIKAFRARSGMPAYKVALTFSHAVAIQQPFRVLGAISRDAVKLFATARTTSPGDTPISRWQFQDHYPQYPPYVTLAGGRLRFVQTTPSGRAEDPRAWPPRQRRESRGNEARRIIPARIPAQRGVHARPTVPARRGGRTARQPGRPAPARWPGAARRRRARDRHGLPGYLPGRPRDPAGLGCIRVQLALPAPRIGYPGSGRRPRHHRRAWLPEPTPWANGARPGIEDGSRAR